jgi:hypothetical protein
MGEPAKKRAPGSRLAGDGNDPSQRLITDSVGQMTFCAIDVKAVKKADDLHVAYVKALEDAVRFQSYDPQHPERGPMRYLAQWCDALRKDGAKGEYAFSEKLDKFLSDDLSEGTEKLKAVDTAAAALCTELEDPDYVKGIKARGPQGMETYRRHVGKLAGSMAGRQWLSRQDGERFTPKAGDGVFAYGGGDLLRLPAFDPKRSIWQLLSHKESVSEWLREIAPHKGGHDEPVEPDTKWLDAAEKAIDNSYIGTFAEFFGVKAGLEAGKTGEAATVLNEAIKAIAVRVGIAKGPVSNEDLSGLIEKFKERGLLTEEEVAIEGGLGAEKQVVLKFQRLSTDEAVWKALGLTAEAMSAVLGAVNSCVAFYNFAQNPNIKNGVGAGSALVTLVQGFAPYLRSWGDEKAAVRLAEEAEKIPEGNVLKFLAEKVAKPEGGKLLPVLGLLQGQFDAAQGYLEWQEHLKEHRAGAAKGAAAYASGGLLIAVGSACILGGALPLGAALVIAGNVLELLGTLKEILSPSARQEWAGRCEFAKHPDPQRNLEAQIDALNELLYQPAVSGVKQAGGILATVKVARLSVSSRVDKFDLSLDSDKETQWNGYSKLEKGKTYGGKPRPELTFDADGNLEKIEIRLYPSKSNTQSLTLKVEMMVDPGGGGSPIKLSAKSDKIWMK